MSDTEQSTKAQRKESKKEKRARKKEKKEKIEQNLEDESVEHHSLEKGEKGTDFDEISIDLQGDVPLSKKQQRLLKKGKLDLEKLAKKNPAPKTVVEENSEESKPKKGEHGIWVGNLSFDTTKEDLIRFIVGKTKANVSEGDSDFVKIEEDDITRVNIPKKENKIKGFAYIDFATDAQVKSAVNLSENVLNGRKLLIKNASSFEGRPEKDASLAPLSKNPPSRILFVGNLSFDTSEDNLEEHFRHCGEIVRIRMATFEDSGKCKGFAFIDFKDESGPTTALKSKLAKKLINRPLRLEYGEDRSKRNPTRKMDSTGDNENRGGSYTAREREGTADNTGYEQQEAPVQRRAPVSKPVKRVRQPYSDNGSNKRLKSSVALATAQRASAAIVPSQGKKISFE